MPRRCLVATDRPNAMRKTLVSLVAGIVLGALFIGGGGRVVMRILAHADGRDPGFSAGGTAEILIYGALAGGAGALAYMALRKIRWPWPVLGLAVSIVTFAGTLLTLPPHIAATAEPFRGMMPIVLCLFGACFLAFGLSLAALHGPRGRGTKVRPD